MTAEPKPPIRTRVAAHLKVFGWAIVFAALAYGAAHALHFLVGLTGLDP
jgi:hypothetical protein